MIKKFKKPLKKRLWYNLQVLQHSSLYIILPKYTVLDKRSKLKTNVCEKKILTYVFLKVQYLLYYLLPPTCLLKIQTNKSKDENKQNKKLNNLTDTKTKRIQKISTISSPSSVAKYLTSKLNMFLFKKLSFILFKSFHILKNNMNRQIKRNSYYYRYEAIRYLTL